MENQTLTITRTVVKTIYQRAEMTYEDFCKTKWMKKYSEEQRMKFWNKIVDENQGELDLSDDEFDDDEYLDWDEFYNDVEYKVKEVIETNEEESEWKIKDDGTWDCVCECNKIINEQCSGYCDPRKNHRCVCDECAD